MKNVQKLIQTQNRVKEIREKYLPPLREQTVTETNATKRFKIYKQISIVSGLDFCEEEKFFQFWSRTYGLYQQKKQKSKRRVYAIPICFCVTLYEYELQKTFPKEKIQIPYTLRGFWEMEKAVRLVEDLVRIQNEAQYVLLRQYRILKHQKKAKAAEYFKILEEFVAMSILNANGRKEISYGDTRFIMNMRNVKLDVVPLCKMLTRYYANVVRRINTYLQNDASEIEKRQLLEIKKALKVFMKKYFISIL